MATARRKPRREQARAAVLRRTGELSTRWLEQVLGSGPIESFELERVGTGQMSETTRVRIGYGAGGEDGAASVVVKTASEDESSRATGVNLGVYEREVRFYRELAPRIGGPLADCHLAVIDADGWFTVVLEDLAPARQGDQIAGCDVEHARLAIQALARLHAPVFADPQLGATPWLNQENVLAQGLLTQLLAPFLERYEERIAPEHREVCERFVPCMDGWSADRRPPLGLVHGDYRLDNMLFGVDGSPRRFVIVDWQTVSWGPAMTDVAYFLGGSLATEDRRAHEQELLREYHDALRGHGVRGLSWEECWEGYRRASFLGLVMTIAPAVLVQRTERGDEMFMASFSRYAQQVLDLQALELLPEPGSGRPPALRPAGIDEGRHEAGPGELWNESWYFDLVSDDGAIGLYTRLGLYPNIGVSWITAFVCGPERPTVAIIDFAAPLPAGEELTVAGERALIEHDCEASLERFRVRLQGHGASFGDPAALLRGERGDPVEVSFDLVWETLGDPYAYRATTRYEIPCRVNGTLTLAGETVELAGYGQRDHSWGTRDWWSAEWVWSACRLDDGARLHGVEFRLPGTPPIGVGYIQPPEGGVQELDHVSASERLAPDGLIASARISYGELECEIEPLAFGPLLLRAADGRVSHFPRAMCRVRAADGREGSGWVEWNRNASLE